MPRRTAQRTTRETQRRLPDYRRHPRLSITESLEEASVRTNQGRTICNRVVREALTKRRTELEKMLSLEKDLSPVRVANIRSLMRSLAPYRINVGLLFFGLLHEAVWNHVQTEMGRTTRGDQHTLVQPPFIGDGTVTPLPQPLPIGYLDDRTGQDDDELFEILELSVSAASMHRLDPVLYPNVPL